jgi:hypothetical protein
MMKIGQRLKGLFAEVFELMVGKELAEALRAAPTRVAK